MYVRGETIPIAKVQRKKNTPKRTAKNNLFCPAGKHQGRENNSRENRKSQQTQNEDKTPQPKLLQRSLPFTAEKFPNFTCEVVSKDAWTLPSGPQRLCFLILVRTFHLSFFGNETHHLSKHPSRKKSKVFVLIGDIYRKICNFTHGIVVRTMK
jgi:hypothetical protein